MFIVAYVALIGMIPVLSVWHKFGALWSLTHMDFGKRRCGEDLDDAQGQMVTCWDCQRKVLDVTDYGSSDEPTAKRIFFDSKAKERARGKKQKLNRATSWHTLLQKATNMKESTEDQWQVVEGDASDAEHSAALVCGSKLFAGPFSPDSIGV